MTRSFSKTTLQVKMIFLNILMFDSWEILTPEGQLTADGWRCWFRAVFDFFIARFSFETCREVLTGIEEKFTWKSSSASALSSPFVEFLKACTAT